MSIPSCAAAAVPKSGAGLPNMPDVWAADKVALDAIHRNRQPHKLCIPVRVRVASPAASDRRPDRRVGLFLDDDACTMAKHQPLPRRAWGHLPAEAAARAPPGALSTFNSAISSNERPERTLAAAAGLWASGLAARCVVLEGYAATEEELRRVHDAAHVDRLFALPESASGVGVKRGMGEGEEGDEDESVDTAAEWCSLLTIASSYNTVFMNSGSVMAARHAVGCAIAAARRVCAGEIDGALCVVRPSGHHAESCCAMGFGLFNSVAAAAADALATGAAQRVLIVDWDIHHGNGSQEMFEADPRVLYFSAHGGYAFPAFVRDGQMQRQAASCVGSGAGAGFSMNCAWSAEGYGDAEYADLWRRLLLPVAAEFAPDLVLVSAGFDSAAGDEEGFLLTPAGYARLLDGLLWGELPGEGRREERHELHRPKKAREECAAASAAAVAA
eukprot:CAMPEP_0181313932 /NCGR_PEP_ID=MMETSP1101-20121128/14529_1 /TAXON_ID=46948 /ORGANISM="Rhodomonas abbreviata, Strain Caron Lab Isolate" /LENGTH=443 /DNA_ID=CAMNT_0023420953 /DNA_START=203 /DNA_END=1531 /DNA_ORIENTATION=+